MEIKNHSGIENRDLPNLWEDTIFILLLSLQKESCFGTVMHLSPTFLREREREGENWKLEVLADAFLSSYYYLILLHRFRVFLLSIFLRVDFHLNFRTLVHPSIFISLFYYSSCAPLPPSSYLQSTITNSPFPVSNIFLMPRLKVD